MGIKNVNVSALTPQELKIQSFDPQGSAGGSELPVQSFNWRRSISN